ncbi:putative galactinol--sucrose galactosyltransferase 6-like protein [Cladobotryum mycophilum]|uniref:Galactinol--sucrose galactosyltransferase 6-like protein n=1 Tax=Cladobotryum mycophilum TaxID=491253 RepID=A0ABR0SKY2_9HYPO
MSESRVIAQTYPPLSRITPYLNDRIPFRAVLDVPHQTVAIGWEVILWHRYDGSEWTETRMSPENAGLCPRGLHPDSDSTTKIYFFTLPIFFRQALHFTLKYRLTGTEKWRWVQREQGLDDGHIIFEHPSSGDDDLDDLIQELNPDWNISMPVNQAPRTQLFSLQVRVPPANGNEPTIRDIEVGRPWKFFMRWFALVRTSFSWLAPRQGKTEFHLDKDAVLLSFLNPENRSLVFLAFGGSNVQTVFRHKDQGVISVHIQNDSSSEETVTILVSEGNDFHNAVASVVYEARALAVKHQSMMEGLDTEIETLSQDARLASWPEFNWYDGLGFCTWNSLGQRLTEEKIIDALEQLKRNGINITNLIIDDNWQTIDYKGDSQFQHGWIDFEAEPSAFPKGLRATVSKIRHEYPAIRNVIVWHAMLGYWGGISPHGKIAKSYKTTQVTRKESENQHMPLGDKITVIDKADVFKFYDEFYRFLAKAGIDGVKADVQSMLDMLQDASDRRELTSEYFNAWNVASMRHFRSKVISCMSQIPQALFHSLLLQDRPAIVARNSDDYYPDVPDSHPWHVWANAHNSMLTQYLNVVSDWDMFQTTNEFSGFHAAARCVSGGPIYITDVPGKYDMNLISQITGRTTNGRTLILRPNGKGKALRPYISYTDNLLLQVGSFYGAAGYRAGILAIFNVSKQPLTELIDLFSFPGTERGIGYIIRAHTTGKASKVISLNSPVPLVTTSLGVGGYEILSAFQALPFTPSAFLRDQGINVVYAANLGLLRKMTGCVAVMGGVIEPCSTGHVRVIAKLKALGVFGVYISTLPLLSILDHFIVKLQDVVIPVETVSVSKDDSCVLEVDVERAWKLLKLKAKDDDTMDLDVEFRI